MYIMNSSKREKMPWSRRKELENKAYPREFKEATMNFRSLKLGLYFWVGFLASGEFILYIDLKDYYEIWPKFPLAINA